MSGERFFLQSVGRNLEARAKSLLSSFFFCARTDLFLGRLRAPPDGFNNPPDTRDRPGERICPSRTGKSRDGKPWNERGIVGQAFLPAVLGIRQAGALALQLPRARNLRGERNGQDAGRPSQAGMPNLGR